MEEQFDLLINSFIDSNVGIANQFLSAPLCHKLQQNIKELQQNDSMKFAGIGNDKIAAASQQMRGDKIFWLDKKNTNPHEEAFLERIEAFIKHLNESCYTGINDYEFHYAVYEPGTAYKKHRDQFKSDNNRKFSLICYLNDDWVSADGGQLVIHQNEKEQSIDPNVQKAVFFKSDEMEHEVLLANKARMSITGWLKRV